MKKKLSTETQEASDIQLDKMTDMHQYDKCDYSCEKKIMLNRHKNTKHTAVTLSKIYMPVLPKDKFQCD